MSTEDEPAFAAVPAEVNEQTRLLPTPQLTSESYFRDVEEDADTPEITPEANTNSQSASGIIAVLLIGVFVANADGSLVLATYGRISSDFNDLEGASWLVTSYILAMGAAQPLYGKLSDIFGRTALIIAAYTLFASGCIICGLAPSLSIVVLGRIVSGIGGAGMGSLVSIMITDLVPVRNVAPWRGYVNIVATTGRSLGGPIGGYLADSIGWRWSFLGQCPLTVIAIVLTWLLVPNRGDSVNEESTREKFSRIDFLGAGLMATTIVSFLLPLEMVGDKSWSHPIVLGCLGATVVLGVLFVLTETRWAKEPIFPLHIIISRNVFLSNSITFFQTAAQLGMMYTVPLFFQVTENASSTVAGAHLVPAIAGVAVAGIIGGQVIKRTGKYKFLLIAATLCSSASYLLLVLRWHDRVNFWESLYIIPGGFGNGLVQSAAFIALTASIKKKDTAIACSGFYLSSNTGMVVGIASTGVVLQAALRLGLDRRLDHYPEKKSIIEQSVSNIHYIQNLEGDLHRIIVNVYSKSLEYAHGVNLFCAIAALLATLFLREHQL